MIQIDKDLIAKINKETAFREWLIELNVKVHEIERGKFKESGTIVSTCVLVIDKV